MGVAKQVTAIDVGGSSDLGVGGSSTAAQQQFKFSSEVVVLHDSNGARAEAIRTLRTHVMAQHLDAGRRGLAVCSASAGVGATFIAVNLAVSLAQAGVKVLFIDGDLRRPQLGEFIEAPQSLSGLKQCLEASSSDISFAIQSEVLPNLSLMFSGGVATNAQELLAGDRFSGLLGNCLRDYDLTLIDTPPANICADARRISTVLGYSLIVARRHVSYVNDLKVLASQLREDRAQVIGTVLNEG
jgi:protein-tyrosine kinase